MEGNMKNSVAIVTGASQGIGRSTAVPLAKDFASVVLVSRNADALVKVSDAVRSAGAEPHSIALDLSQVESPEVVIKTTLDAYGRVDALLNIARAMPQIDLFEMSDEQWSAGMELKLHGARRLTIRAWEALKASQGAVVFMFRSAALDPKPAFAAVAATDCRRPVITAPGTMLLTCTSIGDALFRKAFAMARMAAFACGFGADVVIDQAATVEGCFGF
jgi:3-oxoacyl-[acyl-carrier protein] reductase